MVGRALAALAAACLAGGIARAEPCPDMVGIAEGAVAPCSGVLTPPDYPDACTAVTSSLMACRARAAGARRDAEAIITGARATITRLEAALEDEREAARTLVAPEPVTDWSAVGWGVAGGVVLGALAVVGIVFAAR